MLLLCPTRNHQFLYPQKPLFGTWYLRCRHEKQTKIQYIIRSYCGVSEFSKPTWTGRGTGYLSEHITYRINDLIFGTSFSGASAGAQGEKKNSQLSKNNLNQNELQASSTTTLTSNANPQVPVSAWLPGDKSQPLCSLLLTWYNH